MTIPTEAGPAEVRFPAQLALDGPSWTGSGSPGTQVVWVGTARLELLAQVRAALLAPALVGVEVRMAAQQQALPAGALLLLDHLWSDAVRAGGAGPAALVGLSDERGSLLRAGEAANTKFLVELPAGAPWVADLVGQRLGRLETPTATDPVLEMSQSNAGSQDRPAAGRVVGFLGCVGGVGASTLAVATALRSAESGSVLLVQADPWDAGIDSLLAREPGAEPGWAAISPSATLLDAAALRTTLPQSHGLCLLCGAAMDDEEVPAALPAVLSAARIGFDLTVVDFGRSKAALGSLATCDAAVLVVPASSPGLASAKRLMALMEQQTGDPDRGPNMQVVVREGGPVALDTIESVLGRPVAFSFRPSRFLAERAASGELLTGRAGKRLDRLGRAILDSL